MLLVSQMGKHGVDAAAVGVVGKEQFLKDTRLAIMDVRADGNCQFHALIEGAALLGGKVSKPVCSVPGEIRPWARDLESVHS